MSLLIGWVICPDKYYMGFHLVNKIIWINLGLKRYSSSSLFVVFGRNLPRKRPFWLPSGFADPGTFLCRLRGMWMKMVPGSRNVKRCFKKKLLKALLLVYWRVDRKTVGICFDLVVLHGDDQHLVRHVRLNSTNCTFFVVLFCFLYDDCFTCKPDGPVQPIQLPP